MSLSSSMQAIDGLGGDVHGRVETKSHFCPVDVVVNRFGHADNWYATLIHVVRKVQGTVSANDDQGIQFLILDGLNDFGGNIDEFLLAITDHLAGIRVSTAGRAQDGPTARQDTAHVGMAEWDDTARHQKTVITIFN